MARASVLYIEDEEDDVFFMMNAFSKAGLSDAMHAEPDARRAMTYLASQSGEGSLLRVILLDLNLPMISGFEVLEWIRRQAGLKEVPVVVFSSSGRPEDRRRAEELGANQYVLKPASGSDFVEIVREIRERWLAPG